jgi:hypothetical protein
MPRTSPTPRRRPNGDGSLRSDASSDRLEQLEVAVGLIQQTLDVQFKRIAEMQAEIDRISARSHHS